MNRMEAVRLTDSRERLVAELDGVLAQLDLALLLLRRGDDVGAAYARSLEQRLRRSANIFAAVARALPR